MYEMIFVSRYTNTKGEKYKKAISFIAQYTAVRNNLEIFQIAHFGKSLDLLRGWLFSVVLLNNLAVAKTGINFWGRYV